MAHCYPDAATLAERKVPLTEGEQCLVDFLCSELSDEYELYVEPFLNGDRPDLVLVRPDAGALVIEVKDWDLSAYRYVDRDTWAVARNGAHVRSPIKQVETYKWNLYDLHVSALFEKRVENSSNSGLVGTAVYFHKATETSASNFCKDSKYTAILGSDSLTSERLAKLLRSQFLHRPSKFWDQETYTALHRFLAPPLHVAEQGKAITYRGKQADLVESRAGVRQKVRGVAGCGKTFVLAGRAVRAQKRSGGRVVALTFNITLRNYIRDRISEVRELFPWSAFYISNYHQFFKDAANKLGLKIPFDPDFSAWSDEEFFASVEGRTTRYSAIFVDEVQDYETSWLRILQRYFLAEDGEFVVFGDEKQNVYGQPMGADGFPNTTIVGAWNKLSDSHRLNAQLVALAQAFQRSIYNGRYEADDEINIIQSDLFHAPPFIAYAHLPGLESADLYALIQRQAASLDVHPNDLTVISPLVDVLRDLDDCFRADGENTSRMCETNAEYDERAESLGEHSEEFKREIKHIRRGRKLFFQMNYGTVKLSTVHSFKGWEGHTLVLVLGEGGDTDDAPFTTDELVYTAITRARQNLIVVDTGAGRYTDFFATNTAPLPA